MDKITSPANVTIKKTLALINKRSTSSGGVFLVEGLTLLEEAIRSDHVFIQSIFLTAAFFKKYRNKFRDVFSRKDIRLYEASDSVMKKLSSTETPQEIIALADQAETSFGTLSFNGITIVLDGVQDPGNVGTIIRTAHAFGAEAIVLLPGTSDSMNPKAIRASAGSVFHMHVARAEKDRFARLLHDREIPIAITEVANGTPITKANLQPPLALVFGNEAHGVSKELQDASSLAITIPIPGGAESLNVAQAAAVCLWEITRKRF